MNLSEANLETDRFFYSFPYSKVLAAKVMAYLNQKCVCFVGLEHCGEQLEKRCVPQPGEPDC